MSVLFSPSILEKIKSHETGINCIENFISTSDAEEILDHLRNLKNKSVGKSKSVDREESTKIFFEFHQTEKLKKIRKKIEDTIGEFYVNDFQPHIITSRYPLRLHADTGKNPKDIIFKNVIIPLEIVYKPGSHSFSPPNTIIFKNKWYSQSALFSSNININTDFIIKDKFKNFTDILDIHDFYKEVLKYENKDMTYSGKFFFVDDAFKKYVEHLTKSKRYNLRTNKHITSDKMFDKKDYEKYMTHQPYNDLTGLEIDKAIEWKIGSLVYWDRCRIHSSDNFLKNNVLYKTPLAMFTSKIKI